MKFQILKSYQQILLTFAFALLANACQSKPNVPAQKLSDNLKKLESNNLQNEQDVSEESLNAQGDEVKSVVATPVVQTANLTDKCLPNLSLANQQSKLDLQISFNDAQQLELSTPTNYGDRHDYLQSFKVFLDSLNPDPDCHKSLLFKVTKDAQYFYSAKLNAKDLQSYLQKSISWPELLRRMHFAEEASLDTVRNKLKEARANGDLVESTKWVNQWLLQDANNLTAQVILANILVDQKKYVEALISYAKIIELDPKHEVALYNQAHAFAESGQLDLAIAAWQSMIAKFSELNFKTVTLDSLRQRLVKNLLQDQKFELAESELLKIQTPSFEKEILYVHLLRAKNEIEKAEQKNLELLSSGVLDRSSILYNMVVLEMDLKNKAKAQTYYEELKLLDENLAKDFFFLDHWQDESPKDENGTISNP